MNKLTLSPSEIIALKQAHRACKDKRAADRIKAVYSLGMGFSVEDVVSILMLDEETLRNYIKRYQAGGINALITDHYLGSFSKLSAIQLQELTVHLEHNTYLTVDAVLAHVEETYNVLYSVSGMIDLLHRLKFTYKKSKLVPAKADKEKQEQFLKQLEELRANKGKDDPVLYMDGVHPQHNTMLAEVLDRKGIKWEYGTAIQEYNAGLTTQVPCRLVVKLKTRYRGKISYNKQRLRVEKGVNAR